MKWPMTFQWNGREHDDESQIPMLATHEPELKDKEYDEALENEQSNVGERRRHGHKQQQSSASWWHLLGELEGDVQLAAEGGLLKGPLPTSSPSSSSAARRGIRAIMLSLIALSLLMSGLIAVRNTMMSSDTATHSNIMLDGDGGKVPVNPSFDKSPCVSGLTDDIMVVIKTGAIMLHERIYVHLDTTLRCIDNSLLVSDANATIGDMQVHDVVKDLPPEVLRDANFDYYHEQQSVLEANGGMIPDDSPLYNRTDGWALDKWKFIPMLYETWQRQTQQQRNSTRWYVFIEADTLVDWTNLRILLDTHDHNKPVFLGAVSWINDIAFAHGGSGMVLSHKAMEMSVGKDPAAFLKKWGPEGFADCCGDFLMTRALKSYGVDLQQTWPLIQGDNPQFAPILPDFWCKPVVTMHHVTPTQIRQYWALFEAAAHAVERGRRTTSLLWKEVYKHLLEPDMKERRIDWDNGSLDWEFSREKQPEDEASVEELAAMDSPDGCKSKCQMTSDCMQWSHHASVCKMGHRIRAGNPTSKAQQDEHWVSGWMMDRVKAFKQEHDTCTGADWHLD